MTVKNSAFRVVSLLLAISIMNIFSFGVYSYTDEFTVSASSETACTVTGYNGTGGNVTVPESIDGLSVTAIGAGAFRNNKAITSLALPEGLTKIGSYAFQNCTGLHDVSFPDSLHEIGQCAFTGCSALERVELPDGTEIIGTQAFGYCTSLTELELPCGWKYVNIVKITEGYDSFVSPFAGCSALTDITIPEDMTMLPVNAFRGCERLKKITVPDSITLIGERAFDGCTSLSEIDLPADWKICSQKFDENGKIYIDGENSGVSPFTGCTALRSVKFNENSAFIPVNAFRDCSYLEEITVPESVETVGMSAFENCTYLFRANVGGSDTGFNKTAFAGCSFLNIYGKSGSEAQKFCASHGINFVDESIFDSLIAVSGYAPCGAAVSAYDCDDGTCVCGTFSDSDGRWELTVPAGKEIAVSLTGPDIFCPVPVTVCSEENVDIGSAVFDAVPSEIADLSDLTYLQVSAESCIITACNAQDESIVIPDEINGLKVIGIGKNCFAGSTQFKSIVLPEGILEIESGAFSGCTALEKVYLPQTLKSIGSKAFSGCTSLKSINIPLGIQSIKAQCFDGCTALEKLYIESESVTFGDDVFSGCTSLTVEGNGTAVAEACAESSTAVEGHTHSFEKQTVREVSCTEDGIYAEVCSCGKRKIYNEKATGHHENEDGTVVKAATCTVCGQTDYYCRDCGEFMRTEITNPIPHGYVLTVIEPTCTQQGYTLHTCNDCGDEYRSNYKQPKGHTYQWVNDYTVEGEYAHWAYTCTDCGTVSGEKTESLVEAEINIKRNPGRLTVKYGDSVHIEAELICSVKDAEIQWFVDGEYYSTGKDFCYENITKDFSVSAQVKDRNGNDIMYRNSRVVEGELIEVNDSFIMKIVSFFKNLFRMDRMYNQ